MPHITRPDDPASYRQRAALVSADPQYCARKIAVASDPDGAIATSYGLTTMNIKRA
jgi:hypothetical protein